LSNVIHSTNDPPTRPLALSVDALSNVIHSTNDPLTGAFPIQRTAVHEITRGDLRLSSKRTDTEARLWLYMNHHPDQILQTVRGSQIDCATILTEILLLMNLLYILDESILKTINHILPMINANVQTARIEGLIKDIIQAFKQKFEDHLKI